MSADEVIERTAELLAFVRKGHYRTSRPGFFAVDHTVACLCGESWVAPKFTDAEWGMAKHIDMKQAAGLQAASEFPLPEDTE